MQEIGSMNKWVPNEQISPKEIVGRRAFGSRVFDKSNGVLRYNINVFLDTRVNSGLSVDRLGMKNVDHSVLNYLNPLCHQLAQKRSSKFVGWAQIKVRQIESIGIRATQAVNENNPYHAEIIRSEFTTPQSLRALAFQLCVYASENDFIYRPE